jgi:hypothetical protein
LNKENEFEIANVAKTFRTLDTCEEIVESKKKTFETLNVVKTFQTLKLQGKRQVKTKNFSQS